MKLVDPFKINERSFIEFIDEFKSASEELVPYSLNKKDLDFKTYLKALHDAFLGVNIPPTFVQASTFFMIILSHVEYNTYFLR